MRIQSLIVIVLAISLSLTACGQIETEGVDLSGEDRVNQQLLEEELLDLRTEIQQLRADLEAQRLQVRNLPCGEGEGYEHQIPAQWAVVQDSNTSQPRLVKGPTVFGRCDRGRETVTISFLPL